MQEESEITINLEESSIKRKKFFITFSLVILFIISVVYASIYSYFHEYTIAIICAINGLFTIILYLIRNSKIKFGLLTNLVLYVSLEFCFLLNLYLHNSLPILSIYYCLIPMVALLLLESKKVFYWIIICFICLLFTSFFSQNINYNVPFSKEGILYINILQSVTIFSVVISLIYLYFLNSNDYINTLISQNKIIEKSKEEIVESQKFKDNFFASISHEIRTPMNAIKGISDLLLKNKNVTPEEIEFYKALNTSSNHLITIINDLLDLGKMDEKKLKILHVDFEIKETIENAVKMVQFAANEKSIQLNFNYDEKLPKYINSDPFRMNQILVNLLNNAIKYTSKGVVDFSVKCIEHDSKNCVKFIIKDTGIGIDEEDKKIIFDRFSITHKYENIKNGGIGLGLNIVKNLVELMNGKIWFESTKNIGSTFFVQIPLVESNKDSAISQFNTNINDLFNDITNFTILLVDDNSLNLLVAKKILESSIKNVTVYTAENGQVAYDFLLNNPSVTIVLMDLQMPVLNGKEATKLIKSSPNLAQIPIIAMTATSDTNEIKECMDIGMIDYITKPFDNKNLLFLIRKYV